MKLIELFESERKFDGKRHEKTSYGNAYIYNPTILDVERGNMIRVLGTPAHENYDRSWGMKDWGNIVLDVDYKKQLVLIGEYMGGSKQFSEWASIDDISVTWNIGGYDSAMDKIGGLTADMKNATDLQGDVEKEQELEKQIKFKQ